MSNVSDLFGAVITGVADLSKAVAPVASSYFNARGRDYEIEQQRAAVAAARQQAQAAQSAMEKAQDFFNSNLSKTVNFVLATLAVTLVGVIGYNVFKGR